MTPHTQISTVTDEHPNGPLQAALRDAVQVSQYCCQNHAQSGRWTRHLGAGGTLHADRGAEGRPEQTCFRPWVGRT